MTGFLEVGDVFEVKIGMQVYARIPQKFIYSNVFDGNPKSDEFTSAKLTVGSILSSRPNGLTVHQVKNLNTSFFIGEYIVIEARFTGGGAQGLHDYYPDGWNVKALQLNNGAYDEDGQEISFYQSGAFTAMNEYVPVIRKMKMGFS